MPPLRLGVNIDHVARSAMRAAGRVRSASRGFCSHRAARRHHRAFARGPAPYSGRRHGASEGEHLQAAQLRDGRDRADVDIALKIKPHAVCLVPEKRTERTTRAGSTWSAAIITSSLRG